MKHTPGPWSYKPANHGTLASVQYDPAYVESGCNPVCICHHGGSYPDKATAEANARLIAAAPELLAALESLPDSLRTDVIRAAIRKAKGE